MDYLHSTILFYILGFQIVKFINKCRQECSCPSDFALYSSTFPCNGQRQDPFEMSTLGYKKFGNVPSNRAQQHVTFNGFRCLISILC